MTLYGIDVSNHQREFNFAAAKREGFVFATHKVTESDDYRDPYWPRARDQMREHFPGLFGGYHFARNHVDVNRQADALLAHLGDPSIPVQLDYEDTDTRGSMDNMKALIRAIEERGMRVFANYLPRWYWTGHMGAPRLDGTPPIWNSHYVLGTGYASVLYPGDSHAGWAEFHTDAPPVVILQFSERGQVAGQSIDVNAFRGTEEELRALFGSAQPKGEPVTDLVEQGAGQLHPQPGRLRPIARPQNVNPSTRTPDEPWPYDMWCDIWNETVFDGYDIRPEYADVPDDMGRSLVALLQTVAARQVREKVQLDRIESKLDRILGEKKL